jgi:hypothetical protein
MVYPDVPAAPVTAVPEAPASIAPAPYQPVAETPLDAGTLLGPSTVGGSPDLSASGFVGGSPDLSATGFVGGTPDLSATGYVGGTIAPDLGGTWVDANGTPTAAPDIPLAPGPYGAVATGMFDAANAAVAEGWLGGGAADSHPAPWTPGFDSDHDGVLNERDARPRDPFAWRP